MGFDFQGVGVAIAGNDELGWLAEATREAGLVAKGTDILGAERALADGLGDGTSDLALPAKINCSSCVMPVAAIIAVTGAGKSRCKSNWRMPLASK